MKNNKFCTSSALFFTTCTNTTVKFLLQQCLNKINFLGCGPQDSVGKLNFICHFKSVDGNKRGKVKKKNAHFILIARDVFIALAVVVAKAPYINERDSSIFNWFYCKLV